MSSSIQLPIDQFLPQIIKQLSENQSLVLTAAPGAGKTTRLPPKLIELSTKQILVLEPRRVAALAAAERIATENNWQLGNEVGYQVRFENCSRPETRLLFITEALLSRKLIGDPELQNVGIVVIDEFHERSLHTDLALGLIYELQQLSRSDLKIVVMSATMDAKSISHFLGEAPIIEVPGKSFPLSLHSQNESQLLITGPQFIDRISKAVKSAATNSTGDVLVFLPGVGEIEKTFRELENWCQDHNLALHSLYGNMPLSEQRLVLKKGAHKKIILSTNVAESALTIDGVSCVVDSGLARTVSMSLATSLPKIQVTRISKAAATQRAGRAARQGPGEALRLWNKLDELSMLEFDTAEVFKSDLAESLLLLARMGIRDFENFSWFEKPPDRRLQMAQIQLRNWGALTVDNGLTAIGKKMSELPLHPRLARLMIEAEIQKCVSFASEICAILSEKDFFKSPLDSYATQSDLLMRWEYLDEYRKQDRFHSHLKLAHAIAKPFGPTTDASSFQVTSLAKLLLPAYSDLLCRRRKPGEPRALKVDGSGVKLSSNSCVKNSEFFVALQIMEGVNDNEAMVNMASEIPVELIRQYYAPELKEESEVSFDEKTQRLMKTLVIKLNKMPLENSRAVPLSEREIEKYLPEVALAQWNWLIKETEELQPWLDRFHWFQQQPLEFEVPSFSREDRLDLLREACFGCRNLQDLKNKDLVYHFENRLSSQVQQVFHEQCPDVMLVPTGNKLRLKYFPDKNPTLEVRLQEIFGWNETPKIMFGKVPITLHLLGPNFRPLQVTQDLANFWRGAYQEIRKQLRARYPKHSWPEDPLTAKPVAKGRGRKN